MTEMNLSPQAQSIVTRVKAILLKPKEEWAVINAEPATIQGLFVGYAVLLAAIPAVASLIGSLVFGYGWFGITYRPPLMTALSVAVGTYVLSLVGLAVLALVIEFLAPQFGGEKNRIQAFKVATYSMTAAWVAGVFQLLPALAILAALGGLYGLYLLYLGLPVLMKAPAEKALTYTIVVIVAAVIVNVVIGSVLGAMTGMGRTGLYADNGSVTGTMNVPGYGSVDLGRAEAAGKAADAAIASALADGPNRATIQPVAAEALSGMLPGTVAGFTRGEITSASAGAGGMNTATARASYKRAEGQIDLSVTDLGGAAAFAQLGSAFNVNHSERTGGRYERVANVGGRLTTETYDAADRSGAYSVVVAERFMVEAEGRGVAMADLKAAVAAVGFNRLEAMARAA
jgi:hypothetical protein